MYLIYGLRFNYDRNRQTWDLLMLQNECRSYYLPPSSYFYFFNSWKVGSNDKKRMYISIGKHVHNSNEQIDVSIFLCREIREQGRNV